MKRGKRVDVARVFEEGTPIDAALRQAAREAFLRHKRAGRPVVIWEDGRIVRVTAASLLARPVRKCRMD